MKQTAAWGAWPSAIKTQLLTEKSVRLDDTHWDQGQLYWLESRPQEKGRSVIVRRRADGQVEDVLPRPLNAHSRVHEYGGGSYTVAEGVVYFVQFDDQQIYRIDPHAATPQPQAVTNLPDSAFADLTFDPTHNRLLAVREQHKEAEVINSLVALPLDAALPLSEAQVLAAGDDFYSNPCPSPDGKHLAWLSWRHPDLPWDATRLTLADLDADGRPANLAHFGGPEESLFQPRWSSDGQLYVVSDRSDWWNLQRIKDGQLQAVTNLEAEFATPQWVFAMSTWDFLSADKALACYTREGCWHLAEIDLATGVCTTFDTPHTDISSICCQGAEATMIAAGPNQGPAVYYRNQQGDWQCIKVASEARIDPAWISQPQAMSFATSFGEKAHAFYYPPCNPNFQGPEGSQPPLIVIGHGGPTAATSTALNLKIQFWTSRGFAVVDVNYRGSTGYGRAYRHRLRGQWGLLDVDDVCAAAETLAQAGLADPGKMAIRGSSAGGFTVLAALTFRNTFAAGVSLYGIGDLETLASDTHKFESRYLDRLLGPYPEFKEVYRQRSPIHAIEALTAPTLFLQGEDDKVVPPGQAFEMVERLQAHKVPVEFILYPGEGHGFRQASTIKNALESELAFYSRVFGFSLPDAVDAEQTLAN